MARQDISRSYTRTPTALVFHSMFKNPLFACSFFSEHF